MKKLALLMVVLLAVGGQASAVVGHDCPDDADFCIQSDSNQTEEPNETSNNMNYGLIGFGIAGIVGIGSFVAYTRLS